MFQFLRNLFSFGDTPQTGNRPTYVNYSVETAAIVRSCLKIADPLESLTQFSQSVQDLLKGETRWEQQYYYLLGLSTLVDEAPGKAVPTLMDKACLDFAGDLPMLGTWGLLHASRMRADKIKTSFTLLDTFIDHPDMPLSNLVTRKVDDTINKLPPVFFQTWLAQTPERNVAAVAERFRFFFVCDQTCKEQFFNTQALLHNVLGPAWLQPAMHPNAMLDRTVYGRAGENLVFLSPPVGLRQNYLFAVLDSSRNGSALLFACRGPLVPADIVHHMIRDESAKPCLEAFIDVSHRVAARGADKAPDFMSALAAKMPKDHPFRQLGNTLWVPKLGV